MATRAPLDLRTFDTMQRELERALIDPLSTSVTVGAATDCVLRHADAHRRAMAAGGDLRRSAERGRATVRRILLSGVLESIDAYFAGLAERAWSDDDAPVSIEDVTPQEAAALLKALAEWERALTTESDVNALASRVCARATADARKAVERFKAEQSPEDAPDYRQVARNLVMFEAMIHMATQLGRQGDADEIGRLRDHYAKSSLLAALDVIRRADDDADMFVHFDVAAMLVSVENVVVVISRTIAVIDRERDSAHPHFEAMSEHVVRDFGRGLASLAPTYLRMLRTAAAMEDKAVPQFVFSVARVLVQLARLVRILNHLDRSEVLTVCDDTITEGVLSEQDRLRRVMARDPDLLTRLEATLGAIGIGPVGADPSGSAAS